MASIQKYETRSGNRWAAHWRDQADRQHKRVFLRRKDADAWLTEVKKKLMDGTWQKPKPTLMREVFELWREDLNTRVALGEIRASTAYTSRCNLKVHIEPALSDYRSDRLTPAVMAEWRADLAKKVEAGSMSRKSFNNLFTLLRQIITWARDPARAYLVRDPLIGQKRLRLRKKEAEFLEDADIAALLAAAANDAEANAIVHVMLFGGLRRGEAFALQHGDVDVEAHGGRLRVRRSLYGGVVTPTKTANSERVVDVPASVLDALERHRRVTPPMGDGWIFRSSSGRPLDPANWYKRRFVPLRQRAGLRDGIAFHALRHTFASLLFSNGENPKYVSKQMGHSSMAFTADVYGHIFKSTSQEAVLRMEKVARRMTRQHLRVVGGSDVS